MKFIKALYLTYLSAVARNASGGGWNWHLIHLRTMCSGGQVVKASQGHHPLPFWIRYKELAQRYADGFQISKSYLIVLLNKTSMVAQNFNNSKQIKFFPENLPVKTLSSVYLPRLLISNKIK